MKVYVVVFHVDGKLMQVVFNIHQVVSKSIIFSSLCLYTLRDTVTQLLQSPFDPNGPPCAFLRTRWWRVLWALIWISKILAKL